MKLLSVCYYLSRKFPFFLIGWILLTYCSCSRFMYKTILQPTV